MTKISISMEVNVDIPIVEDNELCKIKERLSTAANIISVEALFGEIKADGNFRYSSLIDNGDIKYRIEEERPVLVKSNHSLLNFDLAKTITPREREYLIGKMYESTRGEYGGNRKSDSSYLSTNKISTRKRIAIETNTSESYVERAKNFAKGVDLADESCPGIKDRILSEEIKPNKDDLIRISRATVEERAKLVKALLLRCNKQA